MKIKKIEALTLPVSDLIRATRFYHEIFNLPLIQEDHTQKISTMRCGQQFLNLTEATNFTPINLGLRIIVGDNLSDVLNHLKSYFVEFVSEEPTKSIGLEGYLLSVKIKDLDGNIIEVATYSDR